MTGYSPEKYIRINPTTGQVAISNYATHFNYNPKLKMILENLEMFLKYLDAVCIESYSYKRRDGSIDIYRYLVKTHTGNKFRKLILLSNEEQKAQLKLLCANRG